MWISAAMHHSSLSPNSLFLTNLKVASVLAFPANKRVTTSEWPFKAARYRGLRPNFGDGIENIAIYTYKVCNALYKGKEYYMLLFIVHMQFIMHYWLH